MKEAHIICTCREVRISDLGLTLKRGQVAVREERLALASRDLEHLRRVGAVAVRYIKKAESVRPPSGPQTFYTPAHFSLPKAGGQSLEVKPTPTRETIVEAPVKTESASVAGVEEAIQATEKRKSRKGKADLGPTVETIAETNTETLTEAKNVQE